MNIDVKVQKAIRLHYESQKEIEKAQLALFAAIDESGLKKVYIINKLNLSAVAFYNKIKKCSFSAEEMKKILEIIS